MSKDERLAHLAMWVKSLPDDVDDRPAGMVKLLRHLIADMDELVAALQPHQRDEEMK